MAIVRSTDRVVVLEKFDPKSDIGLVDPRVFDGKNSLHITMDTSNCLWNMRYEHGTIPPQLRGKFTSFLAAKEHAELYLKTKNIKIVEIKD